MLIRGVLWLPTSNVKLLRVLERSEDGGASGWRFYLVHDVPVVRRVMSAGQ